MVDLRIFNPQDLSKEEVFLTLTYRGDDIDLAECDRQGNLLRILLTITPNGRLIRELRCEIEGIDVDELGRIRLEE